MTPDDILDIGNNFINVNTRVSSKHPNSLTADPDTAIFVTCVKFFTIALAETLRRVDRYLNLQEKEYYRRVNNG